MERPRREKSIDISYITIEGMVTMRRHLLGADSNLSESYVGRSRFQYKAIISAWVMLGTSLVP